jgi:hypothetical protein
MLSLNSEDKGSRYRSYATATPVNRYRSYWPDRPRRDGCLCRAWVLRSSSRPDFEYDQSSGPDVLTRFLGIRL